VVKLMTSMQSWVRIRLLLGAQLPWNPGWVATWDASIHRSMRACRCIKCMKNPKKKYEENIITIFIPADCEIYIYLSKYQNVPSNRKTSVLVLCV
jgi:hypothetical protein